MEDLLIKALIGAGGATPSGIACYFLWKRLNILQDKYVEIIEKNIEGRAKTESTLRLLIDYIKAQKK